MDFRRRPSIALYFVLVLLIAVALVATACASEEEPEEAAPAAAPAAQAPAPQAAAPAPAPTETPVPLEATPIIATAVPAAPAATGDQKYGGTLRKSAGDDLVHFDFMIQTTVRTQQRVGAAYNRLFRYAFDEKGVILPDLAEDWDASGDGLTYNITLQDGIKFHTIEGVPGSGTDLDCQDSVHSLNKYRDVDTSRRAKDVGAIESVECGAGSQDIVIKLSQPDAGLISMLAAGWSSVFPSELPYEDLETTVIGTGPFVWQGYTKGGKAELTKNPDYWRDGLPYMDGIEDIVFAEETASFAAFRAKQLDMNSLMQYLYPEEGRILQEQDPTINVSIIPRLWWHSVSGQLSDPVWGDVKVRQAFNLALDRGQSTQILNQGAGDTGGWQPPWSKWSLPRTELDEKIGKKDGSDMEDRREQAKALLAEAGYDEGELKLNWLVLNTRESRLTPAFAQDQLKLIGVEIVQDVVDRAAYTDRQDRKDFQLRSAGGVAPVLNPSLFYSNIYLCDASNNFSGYCDDEFEEMYKEQLSEQDEDARQELVWAMERKLFNDLPHIQIRWVAEGMAWWPWVKNFHDVDPAYYNNVTLEEVWMEDR
ncbi:MAG: ABC transporter substrate-binding protein [Dehalococcoidia bacterium]|nr:ABC transporter substrate-binding protein [Dehalococcoidia bacterium]